MAARRRPRFLLDLAEELTWLNQKAGAEVAERWYQRAQENDSLSSRHPFIGRERADLKPPGIRSWRIRRFPRWLILYSVRAEQTGGFVASAARQHESGRAGNGVLARIFHTRHELPTPRSGVS